MKFLFCGVISYYGRPGTRDPMYYYFHDTLQEMGHEVDCIDTYPYGYDNRKRGLFNQQVLEKVKNKYYHAVIIATFAYEFYPDILDQIKKHSTLIAWNSDDDWRWKDYSCNLAPHFDLMYTTYKFVFDENKTNYPNLRLSQWGCLGKYDGLNTSKDIDISFVGKAYGYRLRMLYELKKRIDLKFYGEGTSPITGQYHIDKLLKLGDRGFRKLTGIKVLKNDYLNFEEVNGIWNKSKMSLNLMRSGKDKRLQTKSRTFDMGMSGTVMICEHAPELDFYYEPNKEFLPFEDINDLVMKVNYYKGHEGELKRIAEKYYQRTKKEHLWKYRLQKILREADLIK